MIKLGDRIKDAVTGFTGIAVARTEWLHGCVRWTVQPEKLGKAGNVQDGFVFDEPQLIIVKAAAVPGAVLPKAKRTYGPRNDKLATSRQ